jgi:hypothetical protein
VIGVATGWLAIAAHQPDRRPPARADDLGRSPTAAIWSPPTSFTSGVIATRRRGHHPAISGPGRTMSVTGEDAIDTVWEFLASC